MKNINNLINFVSTLPSLGQKSSTRIVLKMLENKELMMYNLAKLLKETADVVKKCKDCGNLDESEICTICNNSSRDKTKICLVSSVVDLWQIEKSESYKGLYYIFDLTDNFYDNSKLSFEIEKLINFIKNNKIVKEIILAFNLDVKTQTICSYISDTLLSLKENKKLNFEITTLAKGIPVGSLLEYIDESTISLAISQRKVVQP